MNSHVDLWEGEVSLVVQLPRLLLQEERVIDKRFVKEDGEKLL